MMAQVDLVLVGGVAELLQLALEHGGVLGGKFEIVEGDLVVAADFALVQLVAVVPQLDGVVQH